MSPFLSRLIAFFLSPFPSGKGVGGWAFPWCAGVYLLGALWFCQFFNWGLDGPLYLDWADVNVPRLTFLRDALQSGQLPLHISDADAMHGGIVRYLTIPDTFISPQAVLMLRFSVLRFNLINVLLLYSAGFAGLLALGKRLHLSLFAFTCAALLFNFNGNILAHYGVGHLTWGGYFLFPWFSLLMLRFLDGERSWRWTLGMSTLLFSIWLQGSFHQYVWLLIFLGLCALTVRGGFWAGLRALGCTLLLSAFRLLPPMLLLGEYSARFSNGFPGLGALFAALSAPTAQAAVYAVPAGLNTAGGWEFDTAVGLAALAALLWFGVMRGLGDPASPYRPFAVPLAGMLLFSLNDIFAWVRLVPVPLVQGERVVTRILSLVLALLIPIAAERFQRWFDAQNKAAAPRLAGGGLFFLAVTLNDLWLNVRAWRVSTLQSLFPPANFFPDKWYAANNYADTAYLGLVFGGLALSAMTFGVLAVLAVREQHWFRRPKPLGGK